MAVTASTPTCFLAPTCLHQVGATAEGTWAASFTSGTITICTGVGRVTATAGAIVMATQRSSDATPRSSCIRQVARVFRTLSVRGRLFDLTTAAIITA